MIFLLHSQARVYVWQLSIPGSAGYYILVAELEIEARSDRANSSPILNEAGAEPGSLNQERLTREEASVWIPQTRKTHAPVAESPRGVTWLLQKQGLNPNLWLYLQPKVLVTSLAQSK